MSTKSEKVQKLLEKFSTELQGLIATGITDNETGMVIAGVIKDQKFNIENAGSLFTESYLKVSKAIEIMQGGNLKEILITSDNQFHILTSLCNGKYHHGVCVDSQQVLIGSLRTVSRLYHEEMEKLLEKF